MCKMMTFKLVASAKQGVLHWLHHQYFCNASGYSAASSERTSTRFKPPLIKLDTQYPHSYGLILHGSFQGPRTCLCVGCTFGRGLGKSRSATIPGRHAQCESIPALLRSRARGAASPAHTRERLAPHQRPPKAPPPPWRAPPSDLYSSPFLVLVLCPDKSLEDDPSKRAAIEAIIRRSCHPAQRSIRKSIGPRFQGICRCARATCAIRVRFAPQQGVSKPH